MRVVGPAERDAAEDEAVRAQAEPLAPERGVGGKGRLRDRRDAERARGEHEVGDPGTAVDRAVDAELRVGRDDRDVRRAEEAEILESLPLRAGAITALDADRLV